MELPDDIHSLVTRISAAGDALIESGDFLGAASEFKRALGVLPQPTDDWSAALWLYVAIGDAYFFAGDYESARVALNRAQYFDTSLENPFIWLRRGQVYFELGATELADDCLASAFMLGGPEIFEREDPKYADYIMPKLKPAADA